MTTKCGVYPSDLWASAVKILLEEITGMHFPTAWVNNGARLAARPARPTSHRTALHALQINTIKAHWAGKREPRAFLG